MEGASPVYRGDSTHPCLGWRNGQKDTAYPWPPRGTASVDKERGVCTPQGKQTAPGPWSEADIPGTCLQPALTVDEQGGESPFSFSLGLCGYSRIRGSLFKNITGKVGGAGVSAWCIRKVPGPSFLDSVVT